MTPIGSAHQPLRVAVRDEIRRLIITGRLAQGDRILEDQLAQELSVSRNPVREALQTLAHEGFVEMEPRRGARVMVLSDARAHHVFEVRAALEALVAGLAATRRSDDHVSELDDIVRRGQACVASGDIVDLPGLNTRYHHVLVDAGRNPLLADMLNGLTHMIEWMYTRRVRERGLWSWDEHAAIAAAIGAGDADRAATLAGEHIRNARDAYFASPPLT